MMRARWVVPAALLLVAGALVAACIAETDGGRSEEQAAMAAVERLALSSSYSFEISAIHTWSFEGRTEEWAYSGEGTRDGAGRFRSRMVGPADVELVVEIEGDEVRAWDTRGPVPTARAHRAFGGPGPGTAPFTVIAYLTHAGEWSYLGDAELGGASVAHLSFVPRREAVAALDEAHREAMNRVQEISGEVWLDSAGEDLQRAQARVQFLNNRGQTEMVVITLDFHEAASAEQLSCCPY